MKDGVPKMVGDKVVCERWCVKDGVCDKVVCVGTWCVKDGVCVSVTKTVCVKEGVSKMVCERWCVTKPCVKDGG